MTERNDVRAGLYAEYGSNVNVGQLLVFNGAPFTLALPTPPITDTRSAVEALRPAAAVVRLGDESAELLAELTGWRESAKPLSVAVLRGGAGTGKTRIATEAVRQALASGWDGGLLRPTPSGVADGNWAVTQEALIVVDYAEAAPSTVLRLITTLDSIASRDSRQRILLLIRSRRSTRPLIDELLAYAGSGSDRDEIRRVLGEASEFSFDDPRFRASEADLAAMYQRAASAFSRLPSLAKGREPVLSAPPYIGRTPFTTPLMVASAALLELLGTAAANPMPADADPVLDEVLAHERRYWAARIEETGLTVPPDRRDLAGAVFTVAPGGNRAEAADLLRVLPNLSDPSRAATRDEIAEWWLGTYPSNDGRIRPVEPDLIGERLVAQVLTDAAGGDGQTADMLLKVAAEATPSGRRALVRTMTRGAADSEIFRTKLGDLLAAQTRPLVQDAQAELGRLDEPEPLAATLTLAIEVVGSVADADEVAHELVAQPRAEETPISLRPLVAALARAGAAAHAEDDGRRASALTLLSTIEGLIGRAADGLEAAEEAVAVRRRLAQLDPDAYNPSLAKSLTTYSNRLSDVGRYPQSLAAAEEGVALHRLLVESGRSASRIDLAVSLNNLSARRAKVGKVAASLEAAKGSVKLFEELADESSDAWFAAADRAMALSTLASRLNVVGEHEAAREAAEASLDIREKLAETNPDLHEPHLALTLNNLAMIYANLEELEKAASAAAASVEIRRRLVAGDPSLHLIGLVRGLNTLSLRQSALGDRSGALGTAEEAMSLLNSMPSARFEATAIDRAGVANNLAAALKETDRASEAIEAARHGIETLATFSETGGVGYEPILASLNATLASALVDIDDLAGAIAASEEALAIRKELWQAHGPSQEPAYRRGLTTLAALLRESGDPERAASFEAEASELEHRPIQRP